VIRLIDKKQQILDAAKRVLAEKSYFEATLEDISKASGVKKSTIYYYFSSKLDLMIGLIEQIIQQSLEAIEELDLKGSQKERLVLIIDRLFKFLIDERELMIVFQRAGYDFLHHRNTMESFEKVMNKFHTFRDRLGEKIGTIETKNGLIIDGKELMLVMTISVWGYCMEKSKEGRPIQQIKKELFKEIFTSFLKDEP